MTIVGVLDTETTGLPKNSDDMNGHRVIEFAVALFRTDDGGKSVQRIGNTWTKRFQPNRSIDKGAQQVHGITPMDLKDAPEFKTLASKVFTILKRCDLIVAHNLDFDMPFLIHELMEANKPVFELDSELFCTMKHGRGSTASGKVPSLQELCWAFAVEYDESEAHAASYDVDVLAEAFFRGVQWGFFKPEALQLTREVST